uniref:U71 n=1 Tax=Tadarida betaherpesvirus TaxID=2749858 RepID=A0A7D5RE15_9BETA|nr:U71 [Tadarida betaherpesvirus]
MGAQCCKRVSGQLDKNSNTLIDYRGRTVDLSKEFSVITDTSSESENESDDHERLIPPPPPVNAMPTTLT